MTNAKINTTRIDANYAAVQGSYCAGMCVLNAFTAVYLIFKGFTNTGVGLTISLLSLAAIFVQIFVSNFADANSRVPLKKIILVLYMITIMGCAVLWLLPVPIAIMITVYCIATAFQRSIMALISAMMMQFSNVGLRVNYGWPRGVCSILFALTAFFMGILIDKYSPNIIMPIAIGLTMFGIISVISMPNPEKIARERQSESTRHAPSMEEQAAERPTSYREMIFGNPALMLFTGASIVLSLGQATAGVFLIRIIEAAGGTAKEMGTAILIQAGIEFPMLFASAWILKRFKVNDILVVSFFAYSIKQLGLALAPSVGAIYGVMAISLFCMGIYAFASVLFVHSIVRPSEMVRAQTIVVLSQSVGQIIGSYFSGALIDNLGLKPLLMIGWIILLAAVALMVACHRVHTRQLARETLTQ
jgi:MFS transporter, PPP family, 3-phenylpropionic acid transporter